MRQRFASPYSCMIHNTLSALLQQCTLAYVHNAERPDQDCLPLYGVWCRGTSLVCAGVGEAICASPCTCCQGDTTCCRRAGLVRNCTTKLRARASISCCISSHQAVCYLLLCASSARHAVASVLGQCHIRLFILTRHAMSFSAHVCQVLVAGDPRPAAQAKHCDWVLARRPLEQLKQQAGADEVVLSDSSGALLEGLTTNFYVIADAAHLAECGHPVHIGDIHSGVGQQQKQQQQRQQGQDIKQLEGMALLTTGAAADALLGITQQRVLQACERLRLPVVLQPARSDTAAAWKEAFLTNW